MVVIKYIGKTLNYRGKTLWDIFGNLKNFGVGRVVVRSVFERYPEKTFMKILSVKAQPTGDVFDTRKVEVLVEKTFRGKTYAEPENLLNVSYKTDYRLLSKEEEVEYCKVTAVHPDKVIPSRMEVPPMMKKILFREYAKKGVKPDEKITLNIAPGNNKSNFNVWADPNECTHVFPVSLEIEKTQSPSLYKGLKFPNQQQ